MDLLPLKATFAPGDAVAIELDGFADATATAYHLERLVVRTQVARGQTVLELPPLPPGGYGVEVTAGGETARTAFDVLDDPLRRPRYGFLARYERGREIAPVVANARRLHLNAIQFYDWMYRHAALLPPSDHFTDALGRPLSLATVRELAAALSGAGSLPMAYAAVYAAGHDEWPRWQEAGLYRRDGRPWTLGEDFLWIVDPSNAEWRCHLGDELVAATRACGFAGFHLDQYGTPKTALRRDGTVVDLAVAFPRLIAHLHGALPAARLIFNNVNNFPTWATAGAPQDAIYIEVWPPHTRLGHLARLIEQARATRAGKPVILAAYMSVFAAADEEQALAAARLTMATIFSCGASHLLAGEDGAVLIDPYYVHHHTAGATTRAVLRDWYDFAVRYGDLLYDDTAVDVTTAVAGGVNEDVVLESDTPASVDPEPGVIWLRVVETSRGAVVHLIDLTAESETDWDVAKRGRSSVTGTRLKLQARSDRAPSLWFASPELAPSMVPLAVRDDGDHHAAELPPWRSWALVMIGHSRLRRSPQRR